LSLRVLLVNKYAHVTGGADRHCLALAKALRELGHEVALLSTASEENVEHEGMFVPASVTHATRDTLPPPRAVGVLRRAFWNRQAARAMKDLLRDFRPDVVHTHKLYPQLSVAPVVVAKRHGVPVVQTLHDYEFMAANPFDGSGGRIDRRESRFLYRVLNTGTFLVRRRVHARAVTAWIAVSRFVSNAHEPHGIRSTVIANFADVDAPLRPVREEERRGIVFLGALSEEKGAQDVLQLAGEVPELPVVVGGRGPLEAVVAHAAEGLPNLDYRGLLGVADALGAMRHASIVVVPSRWDEPGALVALEAMAVGTPIVAYRRGGLSEYVTASRAGLVVEPDAVALTAACRSLLADRDLWRRCSEAGLEASRTLFSRDAHMAAVVGVYERARRSRRGPS
jgi:glycosyltransferase involved in cell wall biosynthesis